METLEDIISKCKNSPNSVPGEILRTYRAWRDSTEDCPDYFEDFSKAVREYIESEKQ